MLVGENIAGIVEYCCECRFYRGSGCVGYFWDGGDIEGMMGDTLSGNGDIEGVEVGDTVSGIGDTEGVEVGDTERGNGDAEDVEVGNTLRGIGYI